jgi:hypothetical protein
MKDYLFVSGCPRSGTTVLAYILNWAPQTFVGLERFAGLFETRRQDFTPALFEPARLDSFVAGDCDYASFQAKPEYALSCTNGNAVAGIPEARHIGDKNPNFWIGFDAFLAPAWAGSAIRIFHIVRNVADVAASYQTRFDDADDNWTHDFRAGVADWTASVRKTADFLAGAASWPPGLHLHVVDYDRLFGTDQGGFIASAGRIYDIAGLDLTPAAVEGLKRVFQNGEERRSQRRENAALTAAVAELVPPALRNLHAVLAKRSVV